MSDAFARVAYRSPLGTSTWVVVGRVLDDDPDQLVLDLRPAAGTCRLRRDQVISSSPDPGPVMTPRRRSART